MCDIARRGKHVYNDDIKCDVPEYTKFRLMLELIVRQASPTDRLAIFTRTSFTCRFELAYDV